MNLLFFSYLLSESTDGITSIVPKWISAMESYDECLWVELANSEMPHYCCCKSYHKKSEYGYHFSLNHLPSPFNHPDIVIFEGVYYPKYIALVFELRKKHIPYIVVPHSSLTCFAQRNHSSIKKRIANLLLFNSFLKQSIAIHYLANGEFQLSGDRWNPYSFIIPNGITIPERFKSSFRYNEIRAVSLGRLDMYQKGIDNLIEAILIIQNKLRNNRFSLIMYGPYSYDYKCIIKRIQKFGIDDIITMAGEVSGPEKEQAFLNSDLFIITSRFEGHSIALLEALSYGLPVVVTPGTNMSEEIKLSNSGWSCPGNDPQSICETLLTMIEEKKSFIDKSQNARLLALQYSWNKIAQQFHNKLCEIVNDEGFCGK